MQALRVCRFALDAVFAPLGAVGLATAGAMALAGATQGHKYLYVDNWDEEHKVIMRYEVHPDGTLSNGQVFLDATSEGGEDAWDGMKIDQQGNLVRGRSGRPLDHFARRQASRHDCGPRKSAQHRLGR